MKTSNLSKRTSQYIPYFILGFIALASMYLLKTSTPYGAGLINDSIAYIAGARSLLGGTGYSQIWLASELQPITHYPPLFSLTLAFVGLFGVDPSYGARAVNILLFGVNIMLIGILGWKIFNDRYAGLLLGLIFAFNSSLFRIHSYAISEPLFLFFCLLGFLTLAFYFMNGRKRILLFALGIVVGMSILDRYVGLALFGALAITLFLLEDIWRSKVISLGIFLMGSIPLPLIWLIYNVRLTGLVADRGSGWHPITMENLLLGIANLSRWLFPMNGVKADQAEFSFPGLFLLAILGPGLFFWTAAKGLRVLKMRSLESEQDPIVFTTAIYACIYPVSVLASITLFDPTTKLQDRILAPLYLSLLILLIATGLWAWRLEKWPVRQVVVIGAVLILGVWVQDFYRTVLPMRQDGQGYANRRIRESSVIRFIDGIPEEVKIYTDSPPSIYSGTGRPSFVVSLGSEEERFLKYYLLINGQIRNGEATLVLFDTHKYHDPVSQANYQMLTMDSKLIVKFGTQKAFMGEE